MKRFTINPADLIPYQGMLIDGDALAASCWVPREAVAPILRVLDVFCDFVKDDDEFGVTWRIADAFAIIVDRLYRDDDSLKKDPADVPTVEDRPGKRRVYRDPIPRELRRRVYERDDYRCVKCGDLFDISLDHIIPVTASGPTTLENLRTLCRSCNSRKGNRIETD